MPIYEFHCDACGADEEQLLKMSDPLPIHCQACGKSSLKKKISQTSFILKGSGWYETDFKSKKSAPTSSSPKEEAKPSPPPEKPSSPVEKPPS
jgi:putative FmdB family regulatory protein